jgi:hypothetical protein
LRYLCSPSSLSFTLDTALKKVKDINNIIAFFENAVDNPSAKMCHQLIQIVNRQKHLVGDTELTDDRPVITFKTRVIAKECMEQLNYLQGHRARRRGREIGGSACSSEAFCSIVFTRKIPNSHDKYCIIVQIILRKALI